MGSYEGVHTPYGLNYTIRENKNDYLVSTRIPQVYVTFRGTGYKVSLYDGEILSYDGNLNLEDVKVIQKWVEDNLRRLMLEWEEKNNKR